MAERRPAANGAAAAGCKLQCFLVEDSPLLRLNLTAALEELAPLRMVGYAEDQRSAVRWMSATGMQCDLMIIDLVLKAGSGLEVLRLARKAASQSKVVILSNFATPDIRQRCQQLGADRVFDKSTELDELLDYCHQVAAPLLQ